MGRHDEQSFDSKEFRRALSAFPTGVAILTTRGLDGLPVGLTCNSFTSVSLNPPLVSWGLRTESRAVEAFRRSGGFAIHVLSAGQRDLSTRFADGRITDKFDGVAYAQGLGGLPLLEECAASFECSTEMTHDAGDHLLFIGRVLRFRHRPGRHPLVFCQGAYTWLAGCEVAEFAEGATAS